MEDTDNRPLVLIPAAGLSTRFTAAGWAAPKWALRIDLLGLEMTMLEHVMYRLPKTWSDRIRVGTTNDQMPALQRIVGGAAMNVGHSTDGQADTLLRMLRMMTPIAQPQSCLILNSDVVIRWPFETLPTRQADLVVGVHHSTDPACSFVDDKDHPRCFVEKKPISQWALSGMWWFKSAHALGSALTHSMMAREVTGSEFYLSTALNHVSGVWETVELDDDEHLDLGTPELVEAVGGVITSV